MKFRDLPIRRKLLTIISIAAGIGLGLNLILFTAGDLQSKRNAMTSQLNSLAQIVAQTSAAAIRFDDQEAASATLAGLAVRPEIVSATITLPKGRVIAEYPRAQPTLPTGNQKVEDASQRGKNLLHLTQEIRQDGELLGMVAIEADLSDAWRDTLSSLALASLTSLLAFAVAIMMATRLQRSISNPLLQLTAMADAVAADGNHNRRLDLPQGDEIGELANRFNAMLEELQLREADLQRHRDQLEHDVEQRTAQLRLAKDQAESASLAKTRFLANMSHELRTPLNAVIGAAQLLKVGTSDLESQVQMVEAIQKSGTNLLGLIEDILDLSRIEVGELHLNNEDFHLLDCVEAALATASLGARAKGLTLACVVAPEVGAWRRGDSNRLRQIVMNLLGNAIKFTPKGEIVLRIDSGAGMDDLHISVEDTGIGIGPASLPHIFEPFRQADDGANRRFGGSGLGLSIVHQLVQAKGGSISVHSELGHGTRFDITLALPPAANIPVSPPPMGLCVAYYEPNDASAQALAAQLERLGCQAMRVRNRENVRQWLTLSTQKSGSPWLFISLDDPLAATVLEGAVDLIDPEHVIGMTKSSSTQGNRFDQPIRLAHNINKPVLRASLVSQLGMVRRKRHANEPVTVPSTLLARLEAASNIHVLVVEDDALNQTIVCRLLSHAGYVSTAANDGAQALALLSQKNFDLVLMDWQMPDMDGLEVTRRMRSGEAGAWGKTVPIVALTANAFAEDRAACMAAGMNDFLTKPVLADRLMTAVQHWTQGTEYVAPASDLAALDAAKNQMPVYDPSVLAALPMVADGSEPEYAQELLAMFLRSAAQTLKNVERAMVAQDARQLQMVVHTLKSTSAQVGALALSAEAARQEVSVRSGQMLSTSDVERLRTGFVAFASMTS
jgi:signal transduction histidine kinase/CheY-like chemotaxis protein/HPt (histidine-containing phosphotransfer) domain-containing protein